MKNQNNAMVIRCKELFTFARHDSCGQIITDNGLQIFQDSDDTIERIYTILDVNARGKASVGRILFEHYQSGEHVGHVTWAKRVANVINAINGEIAYVGQHDEHAYGMFIDPAHTPDCDFYWDLQNALIINNTYHSVVKRIAEKYLPDDELRAAYIANPCRETAWAAFIGGDPEDWDY